MPPAAGDVVKKLEALADPRAVKGSHAPLTSGPGRDTRRPKPSSPRWRLDRMEPTWGRAHSHINIEW
jgi:hypothetical protein